MPYKELKRILYKDLKIDDKRNAIIKIPKGTTRVLMQAYEEPPLTDTQFKTIMNEFKKQGEFNNLIEKSISALDAKVDAVDGKVDAVDAKVDANTKAIKSVQDDLNNIVEKNNLKR